MYTMDHTFSYHSNIFLCTCSHSSVHAHSEAFRGRNFKHFKTYSPRQGNLLTYGNDLVSCGNDFLTCGNDFLSCGKDFLSCGNDLLSCGNEIKNDRKRVLW